MSARKGHRFATRLGFAMAGLREAWNREKSLRTHALATLAVLGMLCWTRAPAMWWALMALTIGLVVVSELLNTAIEALADHLHPQQHEGIRITKDMAAGAVLVASMVAIAVGAAFFVDQVWPMWAGWR